MTKLTCDLQEIRRALSVLFAPGDVVELRILDAQTPGERRPHIESGYFDDWDKLAEAAATIGKAKGWYVTINPVAPALLARAANRIRPAGKDPLTSDRDILQRRWLPIDLDAVRPAGISATDEEHNAALDFALTIRDHLAAVGWPEPILADSGNGAHLLYRVDLPANDGGLVERCLKALAAHFGAMSDRVNLDTSVHNPARIWKLYGTPARKGDSTTDRPHRMARLLAVPSTIEVVPVELLEALAGPATVAEPSVTRQASNGRFDLDEWIARHGLQVDGAQPWRGSGRRWVFSVCPWNPEHQNRSAFVVEWPDGTIGAGCQHNGCAGKGWHDLRDVVEPGWRERRIAKPTSSGYTTPAACERRPMPTKSPVKLPAFDLNILPESFRPWVADVAERMQCPLDFPAVAAMAALAGVVGRQVAVRPKRRDDWTVIPNLWALLIGRPGIMKSPAVKEIAKPITRLEIAEAETHKEAETDHKKRAMVAEARKKAAQKKIEDAVKKGADDALRLAGDAVDEEEAPPVRRRYIVSDPTPEKLQVILQENPNGVLVLRDEAQGFLRSLDKPGREDARAFYLECWNGDGRFTVDRIGRGTLDIPACCVSILATIQPGPLQSYLCAVAAGGVGDDGLLPRFQLAVWPDASAVWKNVDRWPDTKAKQTAREVFDRLADLDTGNIGAEQGDEGDVPFLRFDEAAQRAFDEWRANLEPTVRSGTLSVALEAVLAKYRSLIPSIALLVHLADDGRGPVTLLALTKAIEWGKYLFAHARRIYGSLDGGDQNALLDSIRQLGGRVTAHELRHHGFKGDTETAQRALEALVKEGTGAWENVPPGPRGGRPTCVFVLATTNTKTETPPKPEENVGFGFGADATLPDVNDLLQEAAAADEEAGAW